MNKTLSIFIVFLLCSAVGFSQKDSLSNTAHFFIDSIKNLGLNKVILIESYTLGSSSGISRGDFESYCSYNKDYIILWKEKLESKYFLFNDCCQSDTYSFSDFEVIDSIFNQADSSYKNYKIKKEKSSPVLHNIYRFKNSKYTIREFNSFGLTTATQIQDLYLKFLDIVRKLFYDKDNNRIGICKYIIEENWH